MRRREKTRNPRLVVKVVEKGVCGGGDGEYSGSGSGSGSGDVVKNVARRAHQVPSPPFLSTLFHACLELQR